MRKRKQILKRLTAILLCSCIQLSGFGIISPTNSQSIQAGSSTESEVNTEGSFGPEASDQNTVTEPSASPTSEATEPITDTTSTEPSERNSAEPSPQEPTPEPTPAVADPTTDVPVSPSPTPTKREPSTAASPTAQATVNDAVNAIPTVAQIPNLRGSRSLRQESEFTIDLALSDADLQSLAASNPAIFSFTNFLNMKRTVTLKNGTFKIKNSNLRQLSNYAIVVEAGVDVLTVDNIDITISNGNPISLTTGTKLTLILVGDNRLIGTSSAGSAIQVVEGSELTITAADTQQKLYATGSNFSAAIGGGISDKIGRITINGGNIEAVGGSYASGIGTLSNHSAINVTINGGIVKAEGKSNSAAIGSGGNNVVGGTVNINGGTVTATGGTSAADIGSGSLQQSSVPIDVIMTGGSVNATRGLITNPQTDGGQLLYLNTLTIGESPIADNIAITEIQHDNLDTYGHKDVFTTSGGKLFLWLPQNNNADNASVQVLTEAEESYSKRWTRTKNAETETLTQTVNAQTPSITSDPQTLFMKQGDTGLMVFYTEARTDDGGSLSYQWYRNTISTTVGGEPVGHNQNVHALDNTIVGQFYFYCVVTNTNTNVNGTQTASAISGIYRLTVYSFPSITSITPPEAVNIGNYLTLAEPEVNDNYADITDQGWQISLDGENGWTQFDPDTEMDYSYNEKYIRYFARNIVGYGYSNAVQIQVNRLDLSLTFSIDSITYGEALVPELGGNAGNGAVTFEYKRVTFNGNSYSTIVPTDAGSYLARATIAATDYYNRATIEKSFTIHKAQPTILLQADPLVGALAQDTVHLTATVSGINRGDHPSGTVEFLDGENKLGEADLNDGTAVFEWLNVPVGSFDLRAVYDGDTNYLSANTGIDGYSIDKRQQEDLIIVGVPETITFGDAPFTLSTVGGSGDGAVSYELISGDAVSIDDNVVNILTAGSAVIRAAKAADDVYKESTTTINIEVEKATPLLNLVIDPEGSALATDNLTLTATLGGINEEDRPAGSVRFYQADEFIGQANLEGGVASFTWENVAYGTYDFRAEYAGDANYLPAEDFANAYAVNKRQQEELIIVGAPETITFGDAPFTLSTVGGSGDGAVTFELISGDAVALDGNTVSIRSVGSAVIQVRKSADSVYNETTLQFTLTVNKAMPLIQEDPQVSGAIVGSKLASIPLTGLKAYGTDGSELGGSFIWADPEHTFESSGLYTASFRTEDTNYEVINFDIWVQADTEKPVIISIRVIPALNGAILEVVAEGNSDLTYQWQVEGSWIDIPGATSATFNYQGLKANTSYRVRVIVTDENGNQLISEPQSFTTLTQSISGLPETISLKKGESISWTPDPAGGSWAYDESFITLTKDGNRVSITAKKTGTTTIRYTVNGTTSSIEITIADDSQIPVTGDLFDTNVLVALLLISGLTIILLVLYEMKRKRDEKQQ